MLTVLYLSYILATYIWSNLQPAQISWDTAIPFMYLENLEALWTTWRCQVSQKSPKVGTNLSVGQTQSMTSFLHSEK